MKFRYWLLPVGVVFTVKIALAEGIATDGSMGVAKPFSGTDVLIPQTLGKTEGNNLFHSFADFNIDKGQTVTFTGADNLQNVISRVTGENKSIIDGTLKSEIKNADFYFINPNGITFNANASVDVPAAFHVTTADKMDFGKNGGVFYADKTKNSSLSSESPAALGFLGTSKVSNGLIDFNDSQVTLNKAQTMDVVAGNISVENSANLQSETGEARLVAMQGSGTTSLIRKSKGLPLPEVVPTNTNAGNIIISGTVDTSGDGTGLVSMWGNDTEISYGRIFNDTLGSVTSKNDDAGSITLKTKTLDMNVGRISSSSLSNGIYNSNSSRTNVILGEGKGGRIDISADAINISGDTINRSYISANTYSNGDAGSITLKTKTLDIKEGEISSSSLINSVNENGMLKMVILEDGNVENGNQIAIISGKGKSGSIDISADKINIGDYGYISANTYSNGDAGSIILNAKTLDIDGGRISSSSWSNGIYNSNGSRTNVILGEGKGGRIDISVDKIKIDKGGQLRTLGAGYVFSAFRTWWEGSIITNASSNGDSGSITLKTKTLDISGGRISSSIFGNRIYENGNQIAIISGKGKGGSIDISADKINIGDYSNISTDTKSNSDAGSITLKTKTLDIYGDISSSSLSNGIYNSNGSATNVILGEGKGGSIDISADKINIGDHGYISTDTKSNGDAGSITLKTKTLDIDGGRISSSSWSNGIYNSNGSRTNVILGEGKGGSIDISADKINIDYGNISSNTYSNGDAGSITLKTKTLDILNGAQISNSSSAKGNAGNISIFSDTLKIDNPIKSDDQTMTGILSSSENPDNGGNAGSIEINSKNLEVLNDTEISTSTSNQGNAGIISINSENLNVSNYASILSQSNNADLDNAGNAGKVTVQTNAMNVINGGQITTSTLGNGNAGDITIHANNKLVVDGQGVEQTGILSEANDGRGNAGIVNLKTNTLDVINKGIVTTSLVGGLGIAGKIDIDTNKILVSNSGNVSSASYGESSSGSTGNIIIKAKDKMQLTDSGVVSIEDEAKLSNNTMIPNAGVIDISSPSIDIKNADITSSSKGNVDAGSIHLTSKFLNMTDSAFIKATSFDGNGGNIKINSSERINLKDSQIATTATGATSNGGDIDINSEIMILDTGALLAGTIGGSGGNISLNLQSLIPSSNSLLQVGADAFDWKPYTGINVIGASGTVNNSAPQLNLSGVLANIGNNNFDTRPINQDYCKIEKGSSLSKKGKGGLPLRAKDLQVY